MEKKPFVTKEQLEEIAKTYPTPFYLYDEKGIRENAMKLKEAFSWNKGFREYFAVKATPNPFILKTLQELGCGTDCSSKTELLMSDACGFSGHDIMFSSNDTPPEEFKLAYDLGAIINLDDFTHIECLEKTIGTIPETICCRFNPGGLFKVTTDIMDNPGDAKYGMTEAQITEAYKILKAKGAKNFGIHAFLASNTVTNEYYPLLAKVLFELAVKLKKETGADIKFINLSGGIGIPYRPDQEPNDIKVIGKENEPCDHKYDVTGSLCENNDKFAIDRMLPKIDVGDLLFIHDAGAHGFAMGYNYNGKLKSAELLLKEDGSVQMIRRAETPKDYFATFDFCDILKNVRNV